MSGDIYHRLQEQLDQYAIGFPATESGVEIKILEKLFSEEEAGVYLNLTMVPETPEALAERLKQDPEKFSSFLDAMATKGLLYRVREKGELKYSVAPFMVGIYENMAERMDPELARLFEMYWQEAWLHQFSKTPVPIRFIPISESLDSTLKISPHDQIREYIMSKDRIAVGDCVCRKQKELLGEGCGKPLETCLFFDWYADYFVEFHRGRYITLQEALEIQDRCDKAGLVTLTSNIKDPFNFCHCCECCCVALRGLTMRPRVLDGIVANYYAEVNRDQCSGCETCIDRCQIAAISIDVDDIAVVDRDRCIGCGVCITTCPEEALSLRQKPENEQQNEPLDPFEAMQVIAKARGK